MEEDKLVASPLGIGIHVNVGLFALGMALTMASVAHDKETAFQKIMTAFFFLTFASQFVLSCCSFSKTFLIGSSGFIKFARLGLTCFVAANTAYLICIEVGIQSKSALAATIVAPNVFTVVFLPYFFYINDERSRLRPFVRVPLEK